MPKKSITCKINRNDDVSEINISDINIVIILCLLILFDQIHDFWKVISEPNEPEKPKEEDLKGYKINKNKYEIFLECRKQVFELESFVFYFLSNLIEENEVNENLNENLNDYIFSKIYNPMMIDHNNQIYNGRLKFARGTDSLFSMSQKLLEFLNTELYSLSGFEENVFVDCSDSINNFQEYLENNQRDDESISNISIYVDAFNENRDFEHVFNLFCNLVFSYSSKSKVITFKEGISTYYDCAPYNKLMYIKDVLKKNNNKGGNNSFHKILSDRIKIINEKIQEKNKEVTKMIKDEGLNIDILNYALNFEDKRNYEHNIKEIEKIQENYHQSCHYEIDTGYYSHLWGEMGYNDGDFLAMTPLEIPKQLANLRKLTIYLSKLEEKEITVTDEQTARNKIKFILNYKNGIKKTKIMEFKLQTLYKKEKDIIKKDRISMNIIECYGVKFGDMNGYVKNILKEKKPSTNFENIYPCLGLYDIAKIVHENGDFRYMFYKTFGDFSQILECYTDRFKSETKGINLFTTNDSICSVISSIFNRTLLFKTMKGNVNKINTFRYYN